MNEHKELPSSEIKRRTRRSFVVGFSSFAAGVLGLRWIFTRRDDDNIAWPLRRSLQANEGVFWDFFNVKRKVPEEARLAGVPPRVNGDIGLSEMPADHSNWRLRVITPLETDPNRVLELTLDDIRELPRTETTIKFKCIEGWSENMTCAGVKFSDFLQKYRLGSMDEMTRFPYVGLETPDGKYYVSIDMDSMLHAQTLLCYEMNGMQLSFDNGAPLRLIIPVKYGIKSLKQVGTIRFSESRLPDYWAERGYDWYAGL